MQNGVHGIRIREHFGNVGPELDVDRWLFSPIAAKDLEFASRSQNTWCGPFANLVAKHIDARLNAV